MNRRTFIASTGAALANVAQAAAKKPSAMEKAPIETLRIVALCDAGFPSVDGIAIFPDDLRAACKPHALSIVGAAECASELLRVRPRIVITAHGSAFPADAFPALLAHLQAGGSWINLGGVPLAVPVSGAAGAWRAEQRQTAYHKRLGITQGFPVATPPSLRLQPAGPFESSNDLPGACRVDEAFALYLRLTESKEFPDEDGSEGYHEAKLYPLLHAVDAEELPVAAPVVLIDRLFEQAQGGRWIFAAYRGAMSVDGLRALVHLASFGAIDPTARPSFAAYLDGELPSIAIAIRRPSGSPERYLKRDPLVRVFSDTGKSVMKKRVPLRAQSSLLTGTIEMAARDRSALAHGRYTVTLTVELRHPASGDTEEVTYHTGFWLFDPSMLAGGSTFSVEKHLFLRDGEPCPVTGTTYMSSESHRRFLLEPNPQVWHRDFAAMAAAGVNVIRTGIWTGWKHFMYDKGLCNDAAFRGMDAFLLTARSHDIAVIFTFFAFLPEQWGGDNPFLDPASIRMQQEFISLFARRYGAMNDIMWDLINEPSFCSAKALWTTRPNYDRHDVAAWNAWLEGHGPRQRLRERYRMTEGEPLALPPAADFNDANIFNDARPVRASDYRRFAQDMFIEWIRAMTAAIRANGNPAQLITVGQDEGGTYERPAQLLYARAVDFTSMHNWWFNDDLVWDLVVTTPPGKPALVEETGVMFYERLDGGAWRGESEVRALLLRKLAVSVAGSAGYIQWNWNVNPYIRSDNEAAIGLLRVDGTAKPEYGVFTAITAFIRQHRSAFRGKEDPDITIVVPHSCLYSVRNQATDATRRAVRTLFHDCGFVANAVSEYRLDELPSATKLIILPSPRVLTDQAWNALLDRARAGATLLLTGPLDADEHWLPASRLEAFGIRAVTRPVMNEEYCIIDGKEHLLAFRGEKIQRVEKAVTSGATAATLQRFPYGSGSLLWCPLPVELSDRTDALTALYRHAAAVAGCRPVCIRTDASPAVILLPAVFRDTALYACVSETDRDLEIRFTHVETSTGYTERVAAQQAVLLLIDRKTGAVTGRFSVDQEQRRE
jgi:hypothetical protein